MRSARSTRLEALGLLGEKRMAKPANRAEYVHRVRRLVDVFLRQPNFKLLQKRYVRCEPAGAGHRGRPCGVVFMFQIADRIYVAGSYCGATARPHYDRHVGAFFALYRNWHPNYSASVYGSEGPTGFMLDNIVNELPPGCRQTAREMIRQHYENLNRSRAPVAAGESGKAS